MAESDEPDDEIAATLEEIFDLHLDAMRRGGVVEKKREGYKIESVESVRLFMQATGYFRRLRELQDDLKAELDNKQHYHIQHVLGLIDDYNRILEDIRDNPTFESAVESFEGAEYEWDSRRGKYKVRIESRVGFIEDSHKPRHQPSQSNVPLEGSPVESYVLPRLQRVCMDLESSLIGRCASGK